MGSQQRLPWPSVCGSLELTARARRSSSPAWILPSRGSVCPFSHPCFRWSTLLTRHDRYSFLFSLPSPAPPFVPTTGQRNLLLIFLLANISLRIPWVILTIDNSWYLPTPILSSQSYITNLPN